MAKANGIVQTSSSASVMSGGENNDTRSRIVVERESSFQELQNGNSKCSPENSSSKRKLEDDDSCALVSKDDQSRARCEELKEGLKKEASLYLRSCGWTDEVCSFMRSKKLCAGEAGNEASNHNEHKRLLIADAKLTFVQRIPEALKANLIERLKSFNQEKQPFGPEAS